jgi:hypothetical protein
MPCPTNRIGPNHIDEFRQHQAAAFEGFPGLFRHIRHELILMINIDDAGTHCLA